MTRRQITLTTGSGHRRGHEDCVWEGFLDEKSQEPGWGGARGQNPLVSRPAACL